MSNLTDEEYDKLVQKIDYLEMELDDLEEEYSCLEDEVGGVEWRMEECQKEIKNLKKRLEV